jgi:hypothetical protein
MILNGGGGDPTIVKGNPNILPTPSSGAPPGQGLPAATGLPTTTHAGPARIPNPIMGGSPTTAPFSPSVHAAGHVMDSQPKGAGFGNYNFNPYPYFKDTGATPNTGSPGYDLPGQNFFMNTLPGALSSIGSYIMHPFGTEPPGSNIPTMADPNSFSTTGSFNIPGTGQEPDYDLNPGQVGPGQGYTVTGFPSFMGNGGLGAGENQDTNEAF